MALCYSKEFKSSQLVKGLCGVWQYVPFRWSVSRKELLPWPSTWDKAWISLKKIIDSLHLKKHKDKALKARYNPSCLKDEHPNGNTMAAEQTFVWLSRFKKSLCAMPRTHHLFYLHEMVKHRNQSVQIYRAWYISMISDYTPQIIYAAFFKVATFRNLSVKKHLTAAVKSSTLSIEGMKNMKWQRKLTLKL